ncbi:MAG TPA: hypothetical protein VNB90_17335 [Cytophagaceae bacterium]|jgi:hypothetical protein|nr:hypothetical protein [Cytophagaceae bacterium]
MNHHLNVFRFFNESNSSEFIENNLSRALALCLLNNSLFLNEYIKKIVSEEDFFYLFNNVMEDSSLLINIQVDTAFIEKDNYKKIYAVAMTADKLLSMDNFHNMTFNGEKRHITDIFISIKDICFVIEVKRTNEDCKAQLYNQVYSLISDEDDNVNNDKAVPIAFCWQDIIKILQNVRTIQHITSQNSVFIEDFLELSETHYPMWFEPKPFSIIPYRTGEHANINRYPMGQRMAVALAGVSKIAGDEYHILQSYERLGIAVPFEWASELSVSFAPSIHDEIEYVIFHIYPGNTKSQGAFIYNKSLSWLGNEKIKIDNEEFQIDIIHNVKLSHFMGKYISGVNYYEWDNLIKPLHTKENYYHSSGKWDRSGWADFEKMMDEHFKPEFNWRSSCDWEELFINSDRNFLFMSLGFEIEIYIPYTKLQALDKNENDVTIISKFIFQIADSIKNMIG